MKLWRTTSLFIGMETVQEFDTKQENDNYALALETLDITNYVKEFYNPVLKDWFTYTHNRPEI